MCQRCALNVSPFGRMINKAGSLRAQRQQRRAQCSWQGQRAATLSPHSARTDAHCTKKQTPPTSVRARIAPVVASFIRRRRHICEHREQHIRASARHIRALARHMSKSTTNLVFYKPTPHSTFVPNKKQNEDEPPNNNHRHVLYELHVHHDMQKEAL